MDFLARQVRDVLLAQGVDAAARVIVGCSGGPDSVALAHVVMALARGGAIAHVLLVYVDHGLRAGSDGDGLLVARLAAAGGAQSRLMAVDVDRTQASLENAAREARYAAFESAIVEDRADLVLLAHTATDQAETVLMRILRGAGVVGIAGIPPRRGHYLRPLLGIGRSAVEEYVARHHLACATDPMNDDSRFLRNRVRRTLMPALRVENPEIDAALCRLAGAAREQRDVLEFAAARLVAAASAAGDGLDIRVITDAPPAIAKRALAVAALAAGGQPLEARHQNNLLELLQSPDAGTMALDLPGLQAVREYGTLRLMSAETAAFQPTVTVTGPGAPYVVRAWAPGDRMRPQRLKGRSRKLSDLFIDAKVPRKQRVNAVVVAREVDGVIEWAQFIGPAHGTEVDVTLTSRGSVASNKD